MIEDFFNTMYETGADFTNSFRKLSLINAKDKNNIDKDINDFLKIITEECSCVDEFREIFKPKFPVE